MYQSNFSTSRYRGISEDFEQRRNNTSNNFYNSSFNFYKPLNNFSNNNINNWQKLKDEVFSPGDNEVSYDNINNNQNISNFNNNNSYYNNYNSNYNTNYQTQKILPSYYHLNSQKNYTTYNRSLSSSKFRPYSNFSSSSSKFLLPSESENNKKTLILDLDETLVHSSFKPFSFSADLLLNIFVENGNHLVHVLKRPFVDEFLNEMSKIYEIVVFTASISQYANPLLDRLDNNNYIKYRLFREHCVSNRGLYIKDLKKIGRNLKDMIIIDNNPVSYAYNLDNGIPILTWHYDKGDQELKKLIPLLNYLSNVDDVTEIIKKVVNRNTNEVDYNIVEKIINNGNSSNVFNDSSSLTNYTNYNSNNLIIIILLIII